MASLLKSVFWGTLFLFLILIVAVVLQSNSDQPLAMLTEKSDSSPVTDSWKTADSTVAVPVLKLTDNQAAPVHTSTDNRGPALKVTDSTAPALKARDSTVPALKATGTVPALKATATVPTLKATDNTVPALKATDNTVPALKATDNKATGTAEGKATVSSIRPARNPGCDTHRLTDFKPIQNGYIYNHPDVVNYVWSSNNPGSEFHLTFTQYVSVLSVHTFFRPHDIILHTNAKPAGNYWEKLKQKTNIRVVSNTISWNIGNKRAAGVENAVDYYKLKHILLKHGGITMDFDIVILNGKRLREMLAASECYLACEHRCSILNLGFVGCIKNSSFVAEWIHGYETDYRSRDWHDWLYNCGVYPAELLTRKQRCYNLWLDQEIAMNPDLWTKRDWLQQNGVDWKKKTVAHHFLATLVRIDRHVTEQDTYFRTSESSVAKMIRYVVEASS